MRWATRVKYEHYCLLGLHIRVVVRERIFEIAEFSSYDVSRWIVGIGWEPMFDVYDIVYPDIIREFYFHSLCTATGLQTSVRNISMIVYVDHIASILPRIPNAVFPQCHCLWCYY